MYGPKQLEKGHVAYNTAVKQAADEELLLNIVRMRYVETLDFMAITSISSQLELAGTLGARGGNDTLAGNAGAMGHGSLGWSTRPTFSFIPQRGMSFAKKLVEPVDPDTIAYLVAADWDFKMLLLLLARRINNIDNELGLPSPEFLEMTDHLQRLQISNQLFVGFVPETETVSDPIAVVRVSGTDLVEAAKAGYRFSQAGSAGPFVLTQTRMRPVLALDAASEDARSVERLLRLRPGESYYNLSAGTDLGAPRADRTSITIRTGSLLRSLMYLAQGVEVPEQHITDGLTAPEFPPGSQGTTLEGFFQMRWSKKQPGDRLAVEFRDHWFYIADSDIDSHFTFFHLSELFRLGLAESAAQKGPVLTLPLGGR
jgi:hypothetical protein